MAGPTIEVASAYVTLQTKWPGLQKSIDTAIGGLNVSKAGEQIGRKLSESMGKSIKSRVAEQFANATAKALDAQTAATKALSNAEHELVKARAGVGNAQAKVVIAEEKLTKLRESGKASAGQLEAAEAALAAAQVERAAASRAVTEADLKATEAKRNATRTSKEYEAALSAETDKAARAAAYYPEVAARMQEIGSSWQAAGQQITSVGDALTSKVTKPALVAGSAIGGLISALGFKRLVALDTARGQFKGLGLDVDAVMAQVDAGVTNTSLSMAEGAASAVGILATGSVPLQGLEAQIKRVANVSAAYNVEAGHANLLLNKVLTKNRVEWGDLSLMLENNIPVTKLLADSMGVAQSAVQEMASKGQISVAQLNTAIDQGAGAAATAYAETWRGVTANILANLGRIGASVLESGFVQVKAAAAEFLDVLKAPETKAFATQLGTVLGDAVSTLLDRIRGLIQAWNDLDGWQQNAIIKLGAGLVALGPALKVLGGTTTAIGRIWDGAELAASAVGGWTQKMHLASGAALDLSNMTDKQARAAKIGAAAQTALASSTELAKKGFIALGTSLKAHPIMWIASALAAAAAGLAYFFTQTETGQRLWGSFMESLRPVGEMLAGIGQRIAETFGGVMERLGPVLSRIVDTVGGVFSRIGPAIVSTLGVIGEVLGGAFASAVEFLAPLFATLVEAGGQILAVFAPLQPVFAETGARIVEAFAPVAETFSTSLMPALAELGAAVGQIGQTFALLAPILSQVLGIVAEQFAALLPLAAELVASIAPIVTTLVSQLVPVFAQLLQNILPIVAVLVGGLIPVIAQLVAAIAPLVADLVSKLAPIIMQLAQAVLPLVMNALAAVMPIVAQLVASLAPLVAMFAEMLIPIIEVLLDVVATVFEALAPIIQGALEIVTGIITTITGIISGDWSMVWDGIKQVFAGIWNTIKSIVTGAVKIVKSVIDGALKLIKGIWESVWGGIKSFLTGIWDSMVAWVQEKIAFWKLAFEVGLGMMRDTWSNVWNAISRFFSNIWNTIKGVFDTMIQFVTTKPAEAFEAARDAIGTAWSAIQDLAKKPVKFVIDTVINGLIGTVNKILPDGMKIPEVKLPPGFAGGGVLPGYMSAKRDDVLMPMRSGEGVLVPEVVRGLGPNFVHTLNAVGNTGGVSAVRSKFGALGAGLARGGLVNPLPAGSYSVSQPYHGGHNGIDLAAPMGTRVFAAGDGVVGLARVVPMGGNEVYIQHTNGLGTRYSHLSRFATRPGTPVKAGHVIGYVGSTGMSTGPHLHYMVHAPGGGGGNYANHVNPAPYLGMFGKDLGEAGGAASILDGLVDWALSKIKDAFPGGGMWVDVAAGLAKNAAQMMARAFNPFAASDGHTATLYDNGGWLDPGIHLVANKTRRPEPILTNSQWADLRGSRAGFPDRVTLVDEDGSILTRARLIAAEEVDRGFEEQAHAERRAALI